jgi:glutathione synthase/RimK-type ligase-like ATP-grasp enzyme
LVITSRDDAHADVLIAHVNELQRSREIVRINTEDLLTNVSLVFRDDCLTLSIADSERRLQASEVTAVWFRRPIDIVATHLPEEARLFASQQATAALRGFYFVTHDSARWVNPLPALHRARVKLQQLQLARRLGFRVPKTLVTNDPEQAIQFVRQVQTVCTKSLDEPHFTLSGAIHALFTRQVTVTEIEDCFEQIRACPVLFQELISKLFDIRVVVIGDRVFAFRIFSQEHPLAMTDFRGVAPHALRHELFELPDATRDRVLRYVREQGLVYSSMDLVQGEGGVYFFIENNPNGQYLWLERITGVPLTHCLTQLLLA